jgi:hypothetical protein
VHSFLLEAGASISDTTSDGESVWDLLRPQYGVALASLLKIMVMQDDAPPAFVAKLSTANANIVANYKLQLSAANAKFVVNLSAASAEIAANSSTTSAEIVADLSAANAEIVAKY